MVRTQSHLRIVPKPVSAAGAAEHSEPADETHFLVGADYATLTAIKEAKEKHEHASLVPDSGTHTFDSGERVDLLVYELNRLGVSPLPTNTTSETASANDAIAATSDIPAPFEAEEHGLLLQQALNSKLLLDYFPLHDDAERNELVATWVKQWKTAQPLHAIRAYFGDEIGFYFAFLGAYSRWLVAPALLGVLVFLSEFVTSWSVYGRGIYSLVITSWATAFLKSWKRQESTLRNDWGIVAADSAVLEPPRSDFWGEKRFDVVEGTYYTFFPSVKRVQRYLLTSVVTLGVLAAILKLMFVYFQIEEWFGLTFTEAKGWAGLYQYISLAPSVAYSIVVLVLDAKYSELANFLTRLENHRTDSDVSGWMGVLLLCCSLEASSCCCLCVSLCLARITR